MDRVHYAGDSVLTGSAIAHALLDYAQALAQAGDADTVTIPTVAPDGSPGQSHILVGPASQLICDHEESAHDEPLDEELVDRLHEDAQRLRRHGTPIPTAEPFHDSPGEDWFDEGMR